MKTTDLFEFRFVDREYEQKKLEVFLSKHSKSTLWIKGKRGLGKTEFFHYVLKEHSEYALCYIDIKKRTSSSNILSDFIINLQEHCDMDFMTNVSKKYKQFYNSIYKKTQNITSELFPNISNIVDAILELGYYAVTHSDENKNPLELINDYIGLILNKKKLCICVDNFSRCDMDIAQHFFQIIKRFVDEKNFRACIVTTSEDLNPELKEAIFHQLPYIDIDINKFDEFDYFFQILEPIFEMNEFTENDLIYLYQKCDGSPKKLSTTISKLLEKNGITLSQRSKAKINKKTLLTVLQGNHVKFEESDFAPVQKWIIFSYLCLTKQTPIQQMKELALYISKRFLLYSAYNESIFDSELLLLINNKILDYDINNVVSTHHDLDYIELMDIFNDSQLKGVFSQYTYEFLLQHPTYPDYEELICRHARDAKVSGWEKINFRYGKKLFYNRQIYESYRILSHLNNDIHKLHPIQILFIALVAYETGNYYVAINNFQLLQPEYLKFNQVRYYYFFYLGKSYNNIGRIKDAVAMIEKALEVIEKDSAIYVHTLNILHMYYFEIPEKIEESKKIFNKIRLSYEELYPIIWANTMRGCQNFLDNDICLNILQRAETKIENELEKAFLKTTHGFVLIKLNRIQEAEIQFRESSETIKRLKIHEYSYAANNLAVCYMMKNDYRTAKEILLKALLWNRTVYGSLVIQTHLMICSLYLSLECETDYYYDFLNSYMENHQIIDPIINRKIHMNMGIVCQKKGKHIMKSVHFEKVQPFIINSSSEWRYHILTNTIDEEITRPTEKYMHITTFDPWFLIYAHD